MTVSDEPVAGFTIQNKVLIAMDALAPDEKSEVSRILRSREAFLAHVMAPPGGHPLMPGSRFWEVQAPNDLRILYTNEHGNISVMAIMLGQVLDQFGPSQRRGAAPSLVLDSHGIPR